MGSYGATWEAGGYAGAGSVGELLGSLAGRPAIICGTAAGVFGEMEYALRQAPDAVIFGVNDVGMFLPRMEHWVSLHTDHLGAWKAVRWLQGRAQEKTQYHGVDPRPFLDHDWSSLRPLFALSGYFAMQIAYLMDAAPIILCGCPGSAAPRFFEAEARTDFGYGSGTAGSESGVREQLEREMTRLPDFKARVRSQSGWTRELFSPIGRGG